MEQRNYNYFPTVRGCLSENFKVGEEDSMLFLKHLNELKITLLQDFPNDNSCVQNSFFVTANPVNLQMTMEMTMQKLQMTMEIYLISYVILV